MSTPTNDNQIRFKPFNAKQWPAMSKHVRKEHTHTFLRGFTPDEIRIFKNQGRWVKGEFLEKPANLGLIGP